MARLYAIFFGLGIPIVVLDQLTKIWIRANLDLRESIMVIPGAFRIWHRVNKGAAWSLFGDQSWGMTFLIAIGVLVVIGLPIALRYWLELDERLSAGAFGVIWAGALGNLIDRIRFGEVTDFLDVYAESGPVHWFFTKIAGGPHYPTFNVADMGIVCGAILIMIQVVLVEIKMRKEGADPELDEDGTGETEGVDPDGS